MLKNIIYKDEVIDSKKALNKCHYHFCILSTLSHPVLVVKTILCTQSCEYIRVSQKCTPILGPTDGGHI